MSAKTGTTQIANALALANGPISLVGISPNVPTEQANETNIYFNVTAAAGLSVVPVVELSPDNGITWFPHTTVAALVAVGLSIVKLVNVGKLMRVNMTALAGTGTISAWIENKRIDG